VDERRHNMDGALFVDDEQSDKDRLERKPARRPDDRDDEKADDARRVTQGILDRMDLDARVTVREDDERVVLDIDGPDAGRAIGKKGMTLEALQFLVNKIVNRDPDERRHIVLDSGDYRDRHDSGLVAMAKREAKRAVTSGRAVTLEPMSARDRRVIHVSLAKFAGVSTRSEGEGSDRRLQIIPARGGRNERDDRRPAGSSSPGSRDRDRGPRGPRSDNRDGRPRPAGRGPSSDRAPLADNRTDDRAREPAYVSSRGEPRASALGSRSEPRAATESSSREPVRDDRDYSDRDRPRTYDDRD
jgi:spoIIIJ-associated protein